MIHMDNPRGIIIPDSNKRKYSKKKCNPIHPSGYSPRDRMDALALVIRTYSARDCAGWFSYPDNLNRPQTGSCVRHPHRPCHGRAGLPHSTTGGYGVRRPAMEIALPVPGSRKMFQCGQEKKDPRRKTGRYQYCMGCPPVSFREVCLVGLFCKDRYGQDQGEHADDRSEGREGWFSCCHISFLVHIGEQEIIRPVYFLMP